MPTASAVAEPVATSPVQASEGEQRFLIHGVAYAQYLQLLAIFGDDGPRVACLNGVVELMSPGPLHERVSEVLGRMVSDLIVELGIPALAQGSTTIHRRNRRRGLEPDKCFYLASAALLRGKDLATLKPFPPPDLAIEVEVTAPLLDKLKIYAGLGVPEVWRHNQEGLTILLLGADGVYAAAEQSRALPFLPVAGFRQQLVTYNPDEETAWFRSYRDWVRVVVAPLYQP